MPRQTYTVTFPDGHRQSFDGPTGMSDADLIQRAQQERKFAGGDIPTSFAGGATRHLLEDEPQTVNALLGGAATASGVGAPVVAAIPTVTSGLRHLSQLLATGRTDDPSLAGLAGDVAEGAVMGYGGQALGATARGVGAAKNALLERLPAWARAASALNPKKLALDAATSQPVLGAVERLGEGLTPPGLREAFRSVLGGLTPGVEGEAASGFQGLEQAARRRGSLAALQRQTGTGTPAAVGEANYPAWLARLEAEATPPPRPAGVGVRTGSGAEADLTGADYPRWLERLASDAEPPATPPRPPGVGVRTGSGAQAAPTGADYPAWLERLASDAELPATPPRPPGVGVRTGSGAQAAPTGADYPAWLERLAADVEPAAPPPAGLARTTSAMEAAPTGATYQSWLERLASDVEPPPPPASPPPAPAVPTARPPLPPWMRPATGSSFGPVSAAEGETLGATAMTEGAATAPSMQSLQRAATPPAVAPVEAALGDVAPVAPAVQRGTTAAQRAQFTPEARAARATAAAPASPALQTREDAARQLLDMPSFRGLAEADPAVTEALGSAAVPAEAAAADAPVAEAPSLRSLRKAARPRRAAGARQPAAAEPVTPGETPTVAVGTPAADVAPMTQADVLAAITRSPATASVTAPVTASEQAVLDAMHGLNWQVRKGALVDTADLRTALAQTHPAGAFDRALIELAKKGKIQMQSHAWPGRLTDAEKLNLLPNGRGGWFDAIGLRME